MATAFIHHPIAEKHDTGPGHPETAVRYRAVVGAIKGDQELRSLLDEITPDAASKGMIQAAHTPQHFKRVEAAVEAGISHLDADTVISMRSFDAAMHAAGGLISAVDHVMTDGSQNAFVAARPPGHHATADNSMGFCIFNNAAIGARYAQNAYKDIERVAIIDWDVHHGNGTQGIFYDDPTVFFFSIHQYPWYPGTGSRGETGHGRGIGSTMNLPLKANTSPQEHVRMFESAIEEIGDRFAPDLVIISAGFDAHESDPLGQLLLTDDDYRAMTRVVKDWANSACGGRVVSCLEGGYNLETLGETVRAHVAELAV